MTKKPDRWASDPEDFFSDWQQPPLDDAGLCRRCFHSRHAGECPACFCRHRDPDADAQAGDEAVDNPEPPRGRHRREVPKSSKLARLRKVFRRG